MGDAPKAIELMIAHFSQFLNGVMGEVVWRDFCLHGLICDRFCSILAKFERRSVFWVWPCTTWTIKSFLLIDHSKGFDGFDGSHFRESMDCRRRDGRYAGCFGLRFFQLEPRSVWRCSGAWTWTNNEASMIRAYAALLNGSAEYGLQYAQSRPLGHFSQRTPA